MRATVRGQLFPLILPFLACSLAWGDESGGFYSVGADLGSAEAAALEERVARKPDDWKSRTRLLGYWTRNSNLDASAARDGRSRHLLWLIRHRPKTSILAHPSAASINIKGHRLADADAFSVGAKLWLEHAGNKKASTQTLVNVAT